VIVCVAALTWFFDQFDLSIQRSAYGPFSLFSKWVLATSYGFSGTELSILQTHLLPLCFESVDDEISRYREFNGERLCEYDFGQVDAASAASKDCNPFHSTLHVDRWLPFFPTYITAVHIMAGDRHTTARAYEHLVQSVEWSEAETEAWLGPSAAGTRFFSMPGKKIDLFQCDSASAVAIGAYVN
jgi:hypothetical protein